MAGVIQLQRQSGQDLLRRFIFEAHELADTGFGVGLCVERLYARQVPLLPFPVLPLGFLFIQVTGVRQHYRAQSPAGFVRIDRPLEAFLDETRNAAGVIDVRMAENDGIYLRNIDRECFAIAEFFIPCALYESTFEQQRMRSGAYYVERPGYAFRCAEELQLERHLKLLRGLRPLYTVKTRPAGAIRTSPRCD